MSEPDNYKYQLSFLQPSQVSAAIALDAKTLGGKWSAQGYQQEIERETSGGLGLHFFNEPCPLLGMGFVWCIEDEAHIILIAVDPAYQRQGFGRLILRQLLAFSADRGCTRSTLEVSVHNHAALRLYQSLGFQELGQRPNYYGPGDHAAILWLNKLDEMNEGDRSSATGSPETLVDVSLLT